MGTEQFTHMRPDFQNEPLCHTYVMCGSECVNNIADTFNYK